MKMLIVVDPAFHASEPSDAVIYQDKGGYRLHRLRVEKFTGDSYQIAHWCARLKLRYPEAEMKVEDNGPGAIIIHMLEEMVPA